MSYLLDTNVLSEQTKKQPQESVIEWLRLHESELYVSAISIGELSYGIASLQEGKKKVMLHLWLESVCNLMQPRILNFDAMTARLWGDLQADCKTKGITLPLFDGLIAATAIQHQLTLVTRNISDFTVADLKLVNPFKG